LVKADNASAHAAGSSGGINSPISLSETNSCPAPKEAITGLSHARYSKSFRADDPVISNALFVNGAIQKVLLTAHT